VLPKPESLTADEWRMVEQSSPALRIALEQARYIVLRERLKAASNERPAT
jgi:hypothetical protein